MANPFTMRQIKIRSLEDTQYTTRYNRARFDIAADDMSTDLSQSYLLLRLNLISAPGVSPYVEYTAEDLASWVAQNVCVQFGYEDMTYSPACLIKTARMVNKKTGLVVEEIQFANVLSQWLFQMVNDKETLSAQNLLTGSALEIGKGSGITQSLSSLLTTPISVRILLKEIFGCCNTSNFYLSETNGLELLFELEDRLPILKTAPVWQPEWIDVSGASAPSVIGAQLPEGVNTQAQVSFYDQYPETQGANPYVESYADGHEIINAPKASWKYLADFFEPIIWGATLVQELTLAGYNTSAPQLAALGFVAGNIIKINIAISGLTQNQVDDVNGGYGVQEKILEYIFQINTVTPGDGDDGAIINFDVENSGLLYPSSWIADANLQPPFLSSVEVFPASMARLSQFDTAEEFMVPLQSNIIVLDTPGMIALETLGVVALTGGVLATPTAYVTTNISFELGVMAQEASAGQLVVPDVIQQQGTDFSTLSSNAMVRLPATGKGVTIKKVTSLGEDSWEVEFSDLGVGVSTGYNGLLIEQAAYSTLDPVYTYAQPAFYNVFFFNSMAPGILPAPGTNAFPHRVNPYSLGFAPSPIPLVLSYSIDRFEIVLIQQTKNPKFPMAMGISTWKVEPQTIQYPQYQWSQQFAVTEPNCYNCILLTPSYTPTGANNLGKLISQPRNIARFRNSINNIDMANRDTIMSSNESDYPSSLYSDMLIDLFGNSQYNLRALYGLREIAHARNPVVCVPMKVYSAFTNGMMLGNGDQAYTVQVNLFGDPSVGKTIETGPVFFYKQCLKTWSGM